MIAVHEKGNISGTELAPAEGVPARGCRQTISDADGQGSRSSCLIAVAFLEHGSGFAERSAGWLAQLWAAVSLVTSAAERNHILVPIAFAHGLIAIKPHPLVLYKVSIFYSPEHDNGLQQPRLSGLPAYFQDGPETVR